MNSEDKERPKKFPLFDENNDYATVVDPDGTVHNFQVIEHGGENSPDVLMPIEPVSSDTENKGN